MERGRTAYPPVGCCPLPLSISLSFYFSFFRYFLQSNEGLRDMLPIAPFNLHRLLLFHVAASHMGSNERIIRQNKN